MSNVLLSATGLTLTAADGTRCYFNHFWLRDNCPSSIDPQTRERTYEIRSAPQDLHATAARIEGGSLHVTWSDGGHESRYDLEWLERRARRPAREDPALLPRRHWYADHFPRVARFSQPRLLADDDCLAGWIEALLVEGIAVVTEMPDRDEALAQVATRIGSVRPCIDGYFLDIRAQPGGHSLSFTAGALELHTDIPAEELAPGVQFLHCRVNDALGGESHFVDGAAVAAEFRREHPDDFALLAGVDVPFFYEHDGYDLRARQRIIELDRGGEISGITWSTHMLDVLDLDQRALDRFYPALVRFARVLNDPRYCMRFRMTPGECLVFDNHRIAHGRTAYRVETGARHLRLCYIDRGEMRSTFRRLVKRRRAASSEAA